MISVCATRAICPAVIECRSPPFATFCWGFGRCLLRAEYLPSSGRPKKARIPPFPAYRRSRRLGLQTARNSRMHQREVRSSNPLCSTRKSPRAAAVSLSAFTVVTTPSSKGIDAMTDEEQKIAEAIASAFETLSKRLSRELEDAFNQMAQLIGRTQKQQYEIMALV